MSQNNDITANTCTGSIEITSYETSNPYSIPSDGYIFMKSTIYTSDQAQATIYFADGSLSVGMRVVGTGAYQGWSSIFVKKGMSAAYTTLAGSGGSLYYYPLS